MKIAMMVILRVFAAVLLVMGVKVRREIKKEARKKHEDMIKEMKQLRGEDIEL
jgi:hypothetical protein